MESENSLSVDTVSQAQLSAVNRVTFEPEIHSVDPNSLVSHPVSLEVYQDQDDETVGSDKEFIVAMRKHGGNLAPVLVLASDRKTILSGDRRRTCCKILGLPVRVQYVNPGDIPGDIEQFILDANAGTRPTLTNLQLGRVVLQRREAMRKRQEYFEAMEARKANTEVIDVEFFKCAEPAAECAELTDQCAEQQSAPVSDSPVIEATSEPVVVASNDSQFDAEIADKLGIPKATVQAVAKVTEVINKLEGEGKTSEAEELKGKLNKAAFQTARSLPRTKVYEKGSFAAIKELERIMRSATKAVLVNLQKVASCNPELRNTIVKSFKELYENVLRLKEEESKRGSSTQKKAKNGSNTAKPDNAGDLQSSDQSKGDADSEPKDEIAQSKDTV